MREHTELRSQLLRYFEPKTFARGDDYYSDSRVTSLNVDDHSDDYVDFSSEVRGSVGNVYNQQVTIDFYGNHIGVDGNCDCPVRRNCKHVVAACLHFHAREQKPQTAQHNVVDWIERFAKASAPTASDEGGEFLAYILRPLANDKAIVSVDFLVTKELKKGGLGKGRIVRMDALKQLHILTSYLREQDQDILALVQAINANSWGTTALRGELGYLCMMKILTSGRGFWLTLQRPLQWTDQQRVLAAHWQQDEQSVSTLHLAIAPSAELLLLDPPLYLATEPATIGPLDSGGYSYAQLQQLLLAPAVPAALKQQFSEQLVLAVPQSALRPPGEISSRDITTLPVPQVVLSSSATSAGGQRHRIALHFDYDGELLSPGTGQQLVSRYVDGQIVRIYRDLAAEADAIMQLQRAGFCAADSVVTAGDNTAVANAGSASTTLASIDSDSAAMIFLSDEKSSPLQQITLFDEFVQVIVPRLRLQGWHIEIDRSFDLVVHRGDDWHIGVDEEAASSDWFELRFDIMVDGRSIALFPLVAQVLEHYDPAQMPELLTLHLQDSEYVTINSARLKPVLDTLYELYSHQGATAPAALTLSHFDSARLTQFEGIGNVTWRGGDRLLELGRKLQDFDGIRQIDCPASLNATLRDYQREGLNWLQFLREYNFGGILADDMGLGKTVQALAHLLVEKEQGRMDKPCLIVAPTSVLSNWRREAQQFAPSLKVLVLQGAERRQHFAQIEQYDLVLTSYPLLSRDQQVLTERDYHILILDEAQVVKNPKVKAAAVIRKIKCRHRLCLTGTPMENHLGELWALFDFLMPGFLGDSRQFTQLYRSPIEKHGDDERRLALVARVAPFLLRRGKTQVAAELPEKNQIIHSVSLQPKQAALYESIRIAMEKKVQLAIAAKGLASSHITILDALLKLRQACCDPRLLSLAQAQQVNESAKMEWLMQVLPEMVEEGRRILLFSQFTKMLALIEDELKEQGISYSKLTGQTRNRDAAIDAFKSGGASVFLISLKAGGVGLNLTEADTVIHYDPWWNPAAENQATDRAHRIGQKKSVFVYKLITENSVEEKIVAMQANKQALVQGVYQDGEQVAGSALNADDLKQLFAPLQ